MNIRDTNTNEVLTEEQLSHYEHDGCTYEAIVVMPNNLEWGSLSIYGLYDNGNDGYDLHELDHLELM